MHIQDFPPCVPAGSAGAKWRRRVKTALSFTAALMISALAASPAQAAQQVEIYNMSLRFQHATAVQGSTTWQMDISSAPPNTSLNGELALAEGTNTFTHAGFMLVSNSAIGRGFLYSLNLNIPTDDLNGNGMFDVLEQSAVAGVQTTGSYTDEDGLAHPVQATWNKAAGSHIGTASIHLPDMGVTFNAVFENLHYSGTYDYSKAGSSLSGPVTAARNGGSTNTLAGPLNLQIISPSQLAWGLGQWQTETGAQIRYEGSDLDRSGPLEYSAFYVAADGDLSTSVADYQTWLLVLPNIPDANGNGTPDLIEGGSAATQPRLALTLNGRSLTLTITGGGGRTFDLEATTAVAGAPWTKVGTFTFPTNSETMAVELLPAGNVFWRLKE